MPTMRLVWNRSVNWLLLAAQRNRCFVYVKLCSLIFHCLGLHSVTEIVAKIFLKVKNERRKSNSWQQLDKFIEFDVKTVGFKNAQIYNLRSLVMRRALPVLRLTQNNSLIEMFTSRYCTLGSFCGWTVARRNSVLLKV